MRQEAGAPGTDAHELANAAYQLVVGSAKGQVLVRFQDKLLDLRLADGPYSYTAKESPGPE